MNKLLIFSFTLLMLFVFSCKQSTNNLTVNVQIANSTASQYVYIDLIELDANPITMDSVKLTGVSPSAILKAGKTNHEALYRVRFEKDQFYFILVGDQDNIKVNLMQRIRPIILPIQMDQMCLKNY